MVCGNMGNITVNIKGVSIWSTIKTGGTSSSCDACRGLPISKTGSRSGGRALHFTRAVMASFITCSDSGAAKAWVGS